jgi:hypothetical protein
MHSLDETDTRAMAGRGVTATLIEPGVPRSMTDAAPPECGRSRNSVLATIL